jgi:pSer/pThr/pTyr-binding forkhead associated (FHA) protein
VTIRVRIDPGPWTASFERRHVVRIGRGRANDIRVGHQLVGGRWTVSKEHAVIRWDGTRWSTLNVSQRPGLLSVYEPG